MRGSVSPLTHGVVLSLKKKHRGNFTFTSKNCKRVVKGTGNVRVVCRTIPFQIALYGL
jgi:hypothetical protein